MDKRSLTERQPWELYALVGGVIAQSALVILGNTPHISPWLLMLLAVGVGQALLLPPPVSWLGGLAAAILWVLLRQAAGVWSAAELPQVGLECIGLGVNIALAVRFRQVWQQHQHELLELRALRAVLVAGEVGTGLLPYEVGELRLAEEVDRARLFRRPLGLLLVEMEPLAELVPSTVDLREVYQAVTRQLVSTSLVHDIPFRVSENRVALIMPERDWERLYRDADAIAESLRTASFLDRDGRVHPVQKYVRLYFGLGTYQGEAWEDIDLMRAAEDSLQISRDLAELGEAPVTAHAMPATPVVKPRLVLTDGERSP